MKNFEITFKNGLLIDNKTGNVLNLNPQANFTIQGVDRDFLLEDFKNIDTIPKLAAEKLEYLERKHKKFILKKMASAGDEFYFRIGLGKRTKEDIEREYLFNAIIKEDLYIKSKKKDVWTFCDCVCSSTKLIEGELGFPYHEVKANSLSELFANVVSTYFNKKRSTACNAFKTFHSTPKEQKPSLSWLKNKSKTLLEVKRKAIILLNKQNELREKIEQN